MHLPVLVKGQGILLQQPGNGFVGDFETVAVVHQVEDVEQLACIAAAEAQQRRRLFQHDVFLLEINVLLQAALGQRQQIGVFQRLQHVELTAREQRPDHLKRWILRRGADERHHTLLHSPQERVLLRLGEAVYLVDEEDGRLRVEEVLAAGLLDDIAHVLHAGGHGRERVEGHVKLMGDHHCQRRFAHAGRPPKDEGRDASALYHATQDGAFTDQMLLSDVVVKRTGAHSFCKRLHNLCAKVRNNSEKNKSQVALSLFFCTFAGENKRFILNRIWRTQKKVSIS